MATNPCDLPLVDAGYWERNSLNEDDYNVLVAYVEALRAAGYEIVRA